MSSRVRSNHLLLALTFVATVIIAFALWIEISVAYENGNRVLRSDVEFSIPILTGRYPESNGEIVGYLESRKLRAVLSMWHRYRCRYWLDAPDAGGYRQATVQCDVFGIPVVNRTMLKPLPEKGDADRP